MNRHVLELWLAVALGVGVAGDAEAERVFEMTVDVANVTFENLVLGLDTGADDDIDGNDYPAPPGTPSGVNTIAFRVASLDLQKDIKNWTDGDTGETWSIVTTHASTAPETIALSWTAPTSAFLADRSLRLTGNGLNVDMQTQTQATLQAGSSYSIVLLEVGAGIHPADTDADGRIGLFEYLDYAGPVADVFQLGLDDGRYTWDGAELAPVTDSGTPQTTVFHPADADSDGTIGLFEYLDYAGPVADVFQLGIDDGTYVWDGVALTPKTD